MFTTLFFPTLLFPRLYFPALSSGPTNSATGEILRAQAYGAGAIAHDEWE